MDDQNLVRLKRVVFGLIAFLSLVFLIGFFSGIKNLFLAPLLFYFFSGLALISMTLKAEVEGKLRVYLLISGFCSVVFTAGVAYGVLGIWGFYDIYDPLYLISVIAAVLGFIVGTIGSLTFLGKTGGPRPSPDAIAFDA